jgi:hypothetical protein
LFSGPRFFQIFPDSLVIPTQRNKESKKSNKTKIYAYLYEVFQDPPVQFSVSCGTCCPHARLGGFSGDAHPAQSHVTSICDEKGGVGVAEISKSKI